MSHASAGATLHTPALPTAPAREPSHDCELVAIVQAARGGAPEAWTSLVKRFDRGLRHVVRSYRLAPADVDEVIQATWLELIEHIDRIREPAAIAGWLTMVARRKALRVKQIPMREQLTDDPYTWERGDPEDHTTALFEAERRTVLAGAVDSLPDHHRRLIGVMLAQPELAYSDIAQLLAMPIGSIGPTRARALDRLAADDRVRAITGRL